MEPLQQTPNKPIDNSQEQVPQMRTFSTDLAEELRKHQGSAMKIAVMENEKRFKEDEKNSNDPKKNKTFVVASIILLVLATSLVAGAYYYKLKTSVVPAVDRGQMPVSIIKSEDFTVLNVTKKSASDIAVALNDVVKKTNVQTGMIDSIYITQGATGTETRLPSTMFLSTIGSHVTIEFLHALSPEYMVGMYSYSGQPSLFMVLKGTQHEPLLTGMLQWEQYLYADMAPFFGIDTTGDNAYLVNVPFTETLIENHDTRAVIDSDKKPVLFYSFLDENTIIITNDAKTLTETVRRISK